MKYYRICYPQDSPYGRGVPEKGKEFEDLPGTGKVKNWQPILEEAKLEIFEYIEVYYNKKRLHSTLGYMSPVEYEEKIEVLA